MLSLVMIAGSETDSSRTIGAVMAGAGLNDPLAWLTVVATAVVLLFVWLVYIGRGKRATKVTFAGSGVSLTIDSADGAAKPVNLTEAPHEEK